MIEHIIWGVVLLAFILEYIDASFGMGYGTTLTPILIIAGFSPLEVIPAILLTNVVIGIFAGIMHHQAGNINISYGSEDFKITLVLIAFGAVGIVIASFIAINLPQNILKAYIGVLLLAIGILIMTRKSELKNFSFGKLVGLGSLAAFNKGMAGGGYGPILVGGQILSGVKSKKAIGIALLAEGIVSLIGIIAYGALVGLNMALVVSLLIGGMLAVPFAVYFVKKIDASKLRTGIGLLNIIVGLVLIATLL